MSWEGKLTGKEVVIALALIGVVAAPIGWCAVRLGELSNTTPADPVASGAAEARTRCRQAVLSRLIAPATASFSGWTDGDPGPVLIPGSNPPEYGWAAWVDSQNAFGAKIRTRFSCAVRDGAVDLAME